MVQHQKILQSDALDGGEGRRRGGAGRSAEEAGLPFPPHLWAGERDSGTGRQTLRCSQHLPLPTAPAPAWSREGLFHRVVRAEAQWLLHLFQLFWYSVQPAEWVQLRASQISLWLPDRTVSDTQFYSKHNTCHVRSKSSKFEHLQGKFTWRVKKGTWYSSRDRLDQRPLGAIWVRPQVSSTS